MSTEPKVEPNYFERLRLEAAWKQRLENAGYRVIPEQIELSLATTLRPPSLQELLDEHPQRR